MTENTKITHSKRNPFRIYFFMEIQCIGKIIDNVYETYFGNKNYGFKSSQSSQKYWISKLYVFSGIPWT